MSRESISRLSMGCGRCLFARLPFPWWNPPGRPQSSTGSSTAWGGTQQRKESKTPLEPGSVRDEQRLDRRPTVLHPERIPDHHTPAA